MQTANNIRRFLLLHWPLLLVQSNRREGAHISRPLLKGTLSFKTSTVSQMHTLSRMMLKNMVRNPAMVWLRMAMYIALSIMIATVWVGRGGESDTIQDMVSMIFFIAGRVGLGRQGGGTFTFAAIWISH